MTAALVVIAIIVVIVGIALVARAGATCHEYPGVTCHGKQI